MAIAPVEAAQVMERKTSSPLCFDDLGYSRTTLLMEYSCRTKTMMCCLGGKLCLLCLLDNVVPRAKTFDPVYVTAVHNAWDLAKQLDSWVPYLETTGEAAKTALKCCLLYPCYPAPPMIMLTEGYSDYTGKGDVKTRLIIKDERSPFAKLCGYKKGEFNIYEDGKYFGKVKYEKGCCSKNFYRFEDAEGIMVSKMKLKGTCNETLEKCCCCPCCWIACCTCKNCKTKPISRTLAPTWKSRVEVYAKAGCCKKPKFPILYDTLFVPGQSGDPEDLEGVGDGKVADEATEATKDEEPEPAKKGKEASEKYMVNKNPEFLELKGKQKVVKTYYKGPGCCVKLKRECRRMMFASLTEALDVEFMSDAVEAGEKNQGGVPKGYRKSVDDVWDVQFGKKHTVSQKTAALLHAIKEFGKLQD